MNTVDIDREQLILSAVGIVKRVARDVHLKTGADYDDLVSDGYLGAIDAADKFEQGRGLQFSTYVSHRIKGAVLDGLRDRDHLSRNMRRKATEATTGDDRFAAPISLNLPVASRGGWAHSIDTTLADLLPASDVAFDDVLADVEAVRWAHSQLSGDEYDVVELMYFQGMKLEDIGSMYGVTESRACQIHNSALHHMRVAFLRAGFDLVSVTDRVVDVARRRRTTLNAAEHSAMFDDLLSFWGNE